MCRSFDIQTVLLAVALSRSLRRPGSHRLFRFARSPFRHSLVAFYYVRLHRQTHTLEQPSVFGTLPRAEAPRRTLSGSGSIAPRKHCTYMAVRCLTLTPSRATFYRCVLICSATICLLSGAHCPKPFGHELQYVTMLTVRSDFAAPLALSPPLWQRTAGEGKRLCLWSAGTAR